MMTPYRLSERLVVMMPFKVNCVSVASLRNVERLARSAFVVDTLGAIKTQPHPEPQFTHLEN